MYSSDRIKKLIGLL